MDPATAKVTEEIVNGLVAQIKHQFSYLSQYHANIENLSNKVATLKSRRERVEEQVEEARRNNQDIEDDVISWLERVEVIKAEAEGILSDEDRVGTGCWKGWCLSLKLRHSLSRKAMKEAPKLDALLTEVDQFVTVAKPQLPLGVVHVPTHSSEIKHSAFVNKRKPDRAVEIQGDETLENSASYNAAQHVQEGIASSSASTRGGLESRLSIMGDVIEAVKDNQIRIVRICGMGGIGKTTMAKEVEKIARDQFLFDEIAMVELNIKPDLKTVQLHIAERLGLDLKEDDVKARAGRLHVRLNGKRQTEEGQTGQRPNDGSENKRILVILDNVWRREDLEEIGIPLGDEQRCKILLTSRQNNVCKNIAPEKEFNIGVLSDPEARILFHQSLGSSLCYDQIAEELVKACAGLPIAIKTIARAVANKDKNTWMVAVEELQKSSLEGEYPAVFNCLNASFGFLESVKIKKFFRLCCLFPKGFDVPIEDLARYGMALRLFKDNDKLHEARKKAHRNVETLLHSNLLSLGANPKYCVKIHDLVWDFLVSTSSTGLFMVSYGDGLKEWPRSESDEDYTSISLLCSQMDEVPEGLNFQNLKLLQLTGDRVGHSLKIPEPFYEGMGGLNVLAFRRMTVPLTPKSLQLLTNLRTLSLRECSLGDDVAMIGNLGKLEVLSFAYSDIKELSTELGKLRGLRLLDLNGCQKLCVIAPGVFSRLIVLEELYMRGTLLCSGDRIQAMFSEIASLSKLVVIDSEIPLQVLPMDSLFEKLKKFKLSIYRYGGSTAEYLFPNTLDLKCDSSVLLQDGIKLLVQESETMHLTVTGLKTLFDNSVTWNFSNLESLSLVSCNELVYLNNSLRKIEFRSLKYLSLRNLPKLVGFCNAHNLVEFPQLVELELNRLPLFTSLHPKTETSASVHSHASSINPYFNQKDPHQTRRFQNLRSLKVNHCSGLRHISTPSTNFGELQHLEVQYCESLQAIVAADGREEEDSAMEGVLLLPKLNHLNLSYLPKLSVIVPKGYTLGWSSLKKLKVNRCGADQSDLFANTNNIPKGTTKRELENELRHVVRLTLRARLARVLGKELES
ncbi:hypothetical protein LguiB_020829 [Lonicera macranthoides]